VSLLIMITLPRVGTFSKLSHPLPSLIHKICGTCCIYTAICRSLPSLLVRRLFASRICILREHKNSALMGSLSLRISWSAAAATTQYCQQPGECLSLDLLFGTVNAACPSQDLLLQYRGLWRGLEANYFARVSLG
jgi:hypothetical protein